MFLLTSFLDDLLERVRSKTNTIGLEKFVLEFDPVQTESVEETFKDIHHEQDTESDTSEDSETNVSSEPVNVQSGKHSLLPENGGKFGVGKRQGPKTEV